ncbi:DUF5133 domain-containing protein [Streptomyces sp. NPDC058662]|uniref:DUF5133 domain-containing protein n=1 Tax=Streptomyces sp. NPDC058662 TaxID=3346583 RepID=UPI00365F4182
MSVDVLPSRTRESRIPRTAAAPEAARAWAVGTLMATVPAPAHLAEHILSAAAARAALPVAEVARAMAAGSHGTPVPAAIEQALEHAVRAARRGDTTPRGPGPYLMPTRADAEQALTRFFDARLRLDAEPAEPAAHQALDDALYTLCVLMAQPCAHAAVHEALRYTRP